MPVSTERKIAVSADWQYPNGDPNAREAPGSGIIPLGHIVQQLENACCSGWYEIELHSDRYAPAGYAGLIEASINGMQGIFSKEVQHAV